MCNCNENGNVYNIGMGCCVPMIANPNAYYTKSEVDEKIASGSSGCCITPEEVDEKISAATDGYATEQWVLDQNYISGVDLSNYATKAEIPTVPTNVSSFNNDVPYLTEHQSLSDYATEQWVQNQGYLTEHQSLSAYSTTNEMNNAIASATSGKVDASEVEQEINAATSGMVTSISAGRGISIDSANTISFDLPISAGTYDSTIIEGYKTSATSYCAHAEGNNCLAEGASSHAEGYNTKAIGADSHAEGRNTKANNAHSHAEGFGSETYNDYEHASGLYNKPYVASQTFGDSGNTLFSIGNSHPSHYAYLERHNAFEVRQNGDIYIPNTNESGKTYNTYTMLKLQDVLTSLQSQIDELRTHIQ